MLGFLLGRGCFYINVIIAVKILVKFLELVIRLSYYPVSAEIFCHIHIITVVACHSYFPVSSKRFVMFI